MTTKIIMGINMLQISTHTLTWSVTQTKTENLDLKKISTHTLTWSVTA